MTHLRDENGFVASDSHWHPRIPKAWTITRLRYVAKYRNSNVDKKIYPGQQEVQLCNYTDVYYSEFLRPGMDFMTATATAREIENFELKAGDVIITKDSEDPADIGIPALVTEDMPGVICGYHLTVIRTGSMITARFLHRLLQSHLARTYFFVEAPGVTRYGLNQEAIGNVPIALPSAPEMDAIADLLDHESTRIDTLIEKKARFIERLKEKRAAVITHAVTKGIDPDVPMQDSGVEWLGAVPVRWQHSKIRFLAKLESGHTPSRQVPAYWENCTVPWFTLADIWQVRREGRQYIDDTSEYVSELGLANSSARKLPASTVVLSRTASVGFPAILSREMAVSQDFAAWICGDSLDNVFLYWSLVAMRRELDRLTMGSTHKTIYMPDIADLRIAVPPMAEQRQIVEWLEARVSKIDKIITATARSMGLLKERRSALITAAVTGKIDVRKDA